MICISIQKTHEKETHLSSYHLSAAFLLKKACCVSKTEQLLKLLRISYNHNLYDRFDAIFTKELFS